MKKEKKIRVLMVEPGKHPKEHWLDNDLDSLQKAVSIDAPSQGLIELVDLEKNVVLICNEEGKLLGLKGNREYLGEVFAGVFYIAGSDRYRNLCSLSEAEMEKYRQIFWEPVEITDDQVMQSIYIEFMPWL